MPLVYYITKYTTNPNKQSNVWILATILFSIFASFSFALSKTALTKDWLFVLAKKDSLIDEVGENKISKLSLHNSFANIIYQLSSVIEPYLSAAIFYFFEVEVVCRVIGTINIALGITEYFFLKHVYRNVPTLKGKKVAEGDGTEMVDLMNAPPNATETVNSNMDFYEKKVGVHIKNLLVYFTQPTSVIALSLVMLYFTVLEFDGFSINYALENKVDQAVLGNFRSMGAVFGLLGSVSFPFIEKVIGIQVTGLVGFVLHQSFLWASVVSMFLPGSKYRLLDEQSEEWKNSKTSIHTFLAGITCSRFGLWLLDMSITQQIQLSIDPSIMNLIFGYQSVFCQIATLLRNYCVIQIPDIDEYGTLVILSICSAIFALCLYITSMVHKKIKERFLT
uniref:Solute carrier family 40 protein n=1 Tax=Rhabditophanes sp. KR3021 TaxID=114890 RepID=A0AC35TY66_9BILA